MSVLTKILYIEDDKDIQAIASISLSKIGKYQVTACSSGPAALIKLKSYCPDLIILDVMMPEMDGVTTITKIKEMSQFRDIPFIFMTAKIQPKEFEEYISIGALGVINKPFNAMNLPKEIQALWDKKYV